MAARKIRGLVDGGASVTVIAEKISADVADLARQGEVALKKRKWEAGDVKSAFLIIAATDRPDVNQAIARTASRDQLVNVVDQPEEGNFIFPAVFRRGRLTIAVSTGGASPYFAGKLRDDLAQRVGEDIDNYLDFLFQMREHIKAKCAVPADRSICLKKLVDPLYRDKRRQREILIDVDAFIRGCLKE